MDSTLCIWRPHPSILSLISDIFLETVWEFYKLFFQQIIIFFEHLEIFLIIFRLRKMSFRINYFSNEFIFPTKDMWTPLPLVLLLSLWKMRNVLNRMKNQFHDFYFLSYHEKSSKIGVIWVQKTFLKKKCTSFFW